MYEQINNFSSMVIDYYEKNGIQNMVFDFLHVNIKYTYIDLNSKLIDINSSGVPIYNNGKIIKEELIFVPVVLKKNEYDKLFSNDEDYKKRTFNVPDIIDAGTSYSFDYAKVYKQINKSIPRCCHMINDSEICTIASINGYDKIYWDIQDENDSVLPDYEMEPNWITKVYGIKALDEKINTK